MSTAKLPEARVWQVAESGEFFIREGCHVLEWYNTDIDDGVSVARARVRPGVSTEPHRLKATMERYIVLSGQGEVFVGDAPARAVTAGSVVQIPADCRQWIRNTGNDDLVFLVVCTPRFRPEVYEPA